jgi:hypothetical protein
VAFDAYLAASRAVDAAHSLDEPPRLCASCGGYVTAKAGPRICLTCQIATPTEAPVSDPDPSLMGPVPVGPQPSEPD